MATDWAKFDAVHVNRATQRRKEEEKDPSFVSEVVRAVGTGAHGFIESMVELPNILPGVDYDVNIPDFGKAPQTGVGRFASTAIQFAIPYTAALRGLSLAAKLGGLTRATKVVSKIPTYKKATDFAARRPTAHQLLGTQSPVDFATKGAPRATSNVVDDFIVIKGKSLTPKQRIVHYAAGGAAADFVAFSPTDPNLSNMLANMTEDTKLPVINAISNLLATDANDPEALNRFRNVLEGLGLGVMVPLILKGLSKGITKTGEGIANRIPEDTKLAAKKWAAEKRDKYIETPLQKFSDAGHRLKFIQNKLTDKIGLTSESKRQLDAWGEYHMLQDLKRQQKQAYEQGWSWLNPLTGNSELINKSHLSMHEIEKSLRDMGEDNDMLFRKYVMARQSKQLEETERGSQQAKSHYNGVINQVKKMPKVEKQFEELIVHLQKYNDDALELLRRTGYLTRKEVKNFSYIKDTNEKRIWAPQYRKNTDLDYELLSLINQGKPRVRTSTKFKVSSVSVKNRNVAFTKEELKELDGLKGKEKAAKEEELTQKRLEKQEVENPYNDLFANYEIAYNSLLESVVHMRVKHKLFDTISKLGKDGAVFATRSEKKIHKQLVHPGALGTTLSKENITHGKLPDDSLFEVFTKRYDIGANTDIVWRDGKAELWEIHDPLLLDSLHTMGHQIIKDSTRTAMRVGGAFKNTLTRLVTSAPSFFMGGNFGRDTLSVGVLMKWIPFVDSFRGLFHQLANTKLAREFREAGGTFEKGAYLQEDKGRSYLKDNAERIHTLDGPKGWKAFIGRIDRFTQKFEMASRTRAYQIFKKQGYSQQVAAHKAREIAVDFAQHGSSTSFRLLTSSVPFLNAHIQGLHRTMRALGGKKLLGDNLNPYEIEEATRAWHMMFNMSIVGGILLPMAHYKSEDEDVRRIYEDIPIYIKDRNFVWVMPKLLSEENQIMLIPKPFDFGILPTVVEKFLDEEYIESDANVVREYFWQALRTMSRTGDASLTPQIFRPFVEIALNKKFTGSPIIPINRVGTGMGERNYYTSPTALFLAGLGNEINFAPGIAKSPAQIQYIIESLTGTIGKFALQYITDPVFRDFLGIAPKPDEQPANRWWPFQEATFPGKFGKIFPTQIISSQLTTTRHENEWYDLHIKAKNAQLNHRSFLDHADRHSTTNYDNESPEDRILRHQLSLTSAGIHNLAEINNALEYLARNDPTNIVKKNQLLQEKAEFINRMTDILFRNMRRERAAEKRKQQKAKDAEARNQRNASPPLNATQLREQIGRAYGGLVTRGMAEGGPANDDIIPFEMSYGMIRPYQSTEGLPRLPEGGDRPIGEAQEIRDINQRVIDARPSWTTQPDDGREYGTMLPWSMGPEGDYKWAIPGMAREIGQGFADLFSGPKTGVVTPYAVMSLMDVGGVGVASRAARGVDPNMVSAMGAGARGVGDNRAPADLWYSPLTRAAEEWQGATATAADWANIIRNKWPGRKAEKEWSGVYEWLDEQVEAVRAGLRPSNISRDEILEYLKINELTIEESITDIHSLAYKELTDKIGATKGYLADAGGEAGFTPTQQAELINAHRKKIDDLIKARSKLGEDTFIPPRHPESNLQIPGGENYRELFLTIRKKGGSRIRNKRAYGHGDPANTFARVRMNDRVVNGQRVLHIEEFQSDWNLKGREFGWASEQARLTPEPYEMSFDELGLMRDLEDAPLLTLTPDEIAKKEELRNYFNAREKWTVEREAALNVAADMPYKGNAWTEAAFRRMLRYAAENGYDHMTWVTGKQTQDRYSLVRYIDDVTAKKNGWQEDGKDIWSIIVSTSHGPKTYTDTTDYLHEYVGKELAERIINDGGGKYSNLNLKIGGEWAENLYDKAIPSYARKLARKYGSEVGEMEFDLGHWIPGRTINVGDLEGPNLETVHSIEITPQMRESLLAEPQAVRSGGVPMIAQEGQEQDPMNPTPQISMQDGGLVKRRPQDMAHGGEAAEPIVEGKSYTEEEIIQKGDYDWTYLGGYTLPPGLRGRFSETREMPINEDPIGMEIYKQLDIPGRDDKLPYYDTNIYNKQKSFLNTENYFNINRYKELLSSAPGFSELMDSIMLQQSILNSMSGMDKEDTDREVVVQAYVDETNRAKGLVRQFLIDNHPALKDVTGGTVYISPEQINLTLFKAQQFGRNLGQEI